MVGNLVGQHGSKNGRVGQPQFGVDIFGRPLYSTSVAGVQCKDKDGRLGSSLTAKELTAECKKVLNFTPQLGSFTLATTAPRDQAIQSKARQLSEDAFFPFSVQVWSWDDIEAEVLYRPRILEHFYRNISPQATIVPTIKLSRFTTKDFFIAYFTRPAVEDRLPEPLKTLFVSLAYELGDNAYRHGGASYFKIRVDDNRVLFSDDGIEFDPLSLEAPDTTNGPGKVGSCVINSFLKEYADSVSVSYRHETAFNSPGTNVIEFRFDGPLLPYTVENYYEFTVDWGSLPFGSDAAEQIADAIPLTSTIHEIVWNITEEWALSLIVHIIQRILSRLASHQRLLIYVPRNGMLARVLGRFSDEKLTVLPR